MLYLRLPYAQVIIHARWRACDHTIRCWHTSHLSPPSQVCTMWQKAADFLVWQIWGHWIINHTSYLSYLTWPWLFQPQGASVPITRQARLVSIDSPPSSHVSSEATIFFHPLKACSSVSKSQYNVSRKSVEIQSKVSRKSVEVSRKSNSLIPSEYTCISISGSPRDKVRNKKSSQYQNNFVPVI